MESTNTWEVPRENWGAFLAQVEDTQRGKTVELELVGPELGDQPLAQDVQLRSIGIATKGSSAGAVEIDLGMNGGLDHRVIHPAHLYAIQTRAGLVESLDVEDTEKRKTLVRFKPPVALPVGEEAQPSTGRDILVREHMTSPARVLTSGDSIAEAFDLMQKELVRHIPVVDSSAHLLGILSDRDVFYAKRERGISPEDVTVDEMMTRAPYTVTSSTRLDEAAAVMAQRKYGSAIVVEDERVVGILTTTDVMRALVESLVPLVDRPSL